MKSTNFNYSGGFPFDQSTLKRLQEALFEHIRTFALQLGCQDTGNYIIYGCNVVGANITAGAMFIDGEICHFAGAVGDSNTKIKKQTNISNAAFENGTNPPVFIETIAVVDATGTELSDFTKFNFVNDAAYVHTDKNFTALLLAKLNGIEASAEVNVQSDFNVTNPLSDAYIKNKPIIPNILRSATVSLGAFVSNTTTVVNFPDIGTTDYKVIISLESLNPFGYRGHDIMAYATAAHTATSFDFQALAFLSGARNIKLHYILIKN